jgi:hypothetical protein
VVGFHSYWWRRMAPPHQHRGDKGMTGTVH